jgi:hypothetical protein
MGSLTENTDATPVPNNESDKHSLKSSLDDSNTDIFAEALARYPNDECIDTRDENKVRRKLDFRVLPVLGICYFFYYVDKTTLFVSSRPHS